MRDPLYQAAVKAYGLVSRSFDEIGGVGGEGGGGVKPLQMEAYCPTLLIPLFSQCFPSLNTRLRNGQEAF